TAVVTAPLPEEGIFMPKLYLALAGIWFLGLLFGGLQLLAGHWQTTYRYRRHLLALPREWLNIADHLLERLNYRGKIPQLALSSRIFSPALVGVFRPLILLPVAMVNQLSLEQVEAVLAHEMAHLRRADHWWNLLQSIIELLFYFNPAVHWISRCIREEREHCCDDIVASLGIDPVIYAKTLFQLETQRQLSPGLALAARPGSLLGRIERLLLNTPNQYRMKPGMLLFLLLLVSTLFSLNSPTPVTSSPNHPEERMVPVTEAEVSVNGLIKKDLGTTAGAELWRNSHALAQDTLPPQAGSRQHLFMNRNGKEIELEKVNGDITRLEIDGELIAPEDYDKYADLLQSYNFRAPAPPAPPTPPNAPFAPSPPAPPTPPTPPVAPFNGFDGEGNSFYWEDDNGQTLRFELFGDDEGMTFILPDMDSVMHLRFESMRNFDFPEGILEFQGNAEEWQEHMEEFQSRIGELRNQFFSWEEWGENNPFHMDSSSLRFRMLSPGNGQGFHFELDGEGNGFGIDGNRRFYFDENGEREFTEEDVFERYLEQDDLERLRDDDRSYLFSGSERVHRISGQRFAGLAKNFQRRGLLSVQQIERIQITEKELKINGEKVSDALFKRYREEYQDRYRVEWEELGEFDIDFQPETTRLGN
ncbi:MAG: M56 family metallopeptidase, partial [Bacteroidota bacterium]